MPTNDTSGTPPSAEERLGQLRARGFSEREAEALRQYSDDESIRRLGVERLRRFAGQYADQVELPEDRDEPREDRDTEPIVEQRS